MLGYPTRLFLLHAVRGRSEPIALDAARIAPSGLPFGFAIVAFLVVHARFQFAIFAVASHNYVVVSHVAVVAVAGSAIAVLLPVLLITNVAFAL